MVSLICAQAQLPRQLMKRALPWESGVTKRSMYSSRFEHRDEAGVLVFQVLGNGKALPVVGQTAADVNDRAFGNSLVVAPL